MCDKDQGSDRANIDAHTPFSALMMPRSYACCRGLGTCLGVLAVALAMTPWMLPKMRATVSAVSAECTC
jgi:uncharacterized membrane protein